KMGRSVIPDAVFAIWWNDGLVREYRLEVDNETRSLRAFHQKMLRYIRMQYGHVQSASEPLTLVVARHEEWLERYRKVAAGLRIHGAIAFTTFEALTQGLMAAIWSTQNNDAKYSL